MTGWKRQDINLPVRLGDVSVAEVSLHAAVMTTHFSQLSPSLIESFPTATLQRLDADVAVIHSCPITGSVPRLALQQGGIRYVPERFPRFHTEVTGEFEEYLAAQFRSKSRSTLKRKVKKFAKQTGGELDLREYRTPTQVAVWHDMARVVSATTYQEKLLKRGLPDDPRFVQELQELARADLFRGYLLFDDQAPVAYLSCPITDGGAMIYDHVGHDPRAERLSPGTVLLYEVLSRAFADDAITIFDFTEGDGDHKQRFATHETPCADVFFFATTAKNLLTVGAHLAAERSARATLTVLDRLGVKDRLRKVVRKLA